MEIIHLVLGKANPQRMNGVNNMVHELASRQKLAGQKVEVWGITKNPAHDYPERVYTTLLFQQPVIPFWIPPSLKLAIRTKKQGTIFHLHGGFIPVMYAVARILWGAGIPFVFTPHGSYNALAMKKNYLSKKIYFNFFERPLLEYSLRVHVLGKSELVGLIDLYTTKKIQLIPYGFDCRQAVAVRGTSRTFKIGYCGRIDILTKGLKELLEGFRAFHQLIPESELWIIGDGGEMITFKSMISERGMGNEVVLHGARYGAEKNKLLAQLDVFAAPSRNEGLPTAVLEAAAMGIPCLVTEATNTGEWIRSYKAGYVMNHTCPKGIEVGLHNLYEQFRLPVNRKTAGENAQQMIREVFNWTTILKQFNQLYA